MPETTTNRDSAVPDADGLLDEIGGFRTRIPLDPVPPSEDPRENEVWIRRRAVLTRTLYENYPDHDQALFCLQEYWILLGMQPDLFLDVEDDLSDAPIETTGGFQEYNFRVDGVRESWIEAYGFISVRRLAEARRILEDYPQLPIADWAHLELISELFHAILDFDPEQGSKAELQRIADELLSTVGRFLDYRKNVGTPTNCERFPGHWQFGTRRSAESLVFAAEALARIGRDTQFSYLSEAEELFPDDEALCSLRRKLEAENQRFELSFKDLLSGKSIDIDDYRGDVVLIDFWATWCQPCLNSIPYLKDLLKRQGNRGLKMFGVSCDLAMSVLDGEPVLTTTPTPEEQNELETRVRKCIETHGIDWPMFIDDGFHEKWGVKSIPTIFAVDRKGVLRSTRARESLEQLVEELLNE